MEKSQLKYLIKQPKIISENTPLLILLHGYGSNESDLFSFANELPAALLIISAQAIQPLGNNSYAWYTINFNNSQGKFSNIPEAIVARDTIAKFIGDMQQKYNIKPAKTFVLGFSQGTILSYAVALNYPKLLSGVIALSGYINTDLLPNSFADKDYANLDFFISHGTVDQILPFEWGKKAPEFLNSLKIKNCFKSYAVGHGVAPQNFFDLKKWLQERL